MFLNAGDDNGASADYCRLRRLQAEDWATELTKKGVALAHQQKDFEAIKTYDEVLAAVSDFVPALVARGAAKANLSSFRDAIRDFKLALSYDPHEKNAAEYMRRCKEKLDPVKMMKEKEKSHFLTISRAGFSDRGSGSVSFAQSELEKRDKSSQTILSKESLDDLDAEKLVKLLLMSEEKQKSKKRGKEKKKKKKKELKKKRRKRSSLSPSPSRSRSRSRSLSPSHTTSRCSDQKPGKTRELRDKSQSQEDCSLIEPPVRILVE